MRNSSFFKIAGAALAILLVNIPAVSLAQQQNADVTVVVNGQTMSFDQPPMEEGGRVFVPLRGVFERLGASVVYQNGQINATGNGRTVSLQIGSTQATVDGRPQTLDSAPFVEGSRTLVPLRFIAQALGARVDWNNETSTVTIYGGANGGAGGGYRPGYSGGAPMPPMNASNYLTDVRPRGETRGREPMIAAHFAAPVRRGSLRVTLDGVDITSSVYFNTGGFQYTPQRPLFFGTHHVRVSGTTRDGASFSTGWDFQV
ncbi:MAG TPA: copper amine oxidase N-terminal domain-containing protein [Candidatus Acidoferrales bacterium]|nr:copper amine oxidase N-terminal domain-containing protein [Candidatus Acidoferrales bacterium]